jgi:hypothetical protein
MKKFIEKLFGFDKIKEAKAQAEKLKQEAIEAAEEAKRIAEEAKLSPKELATKRGQPWVAVLDTKVNPENPRNGFFELDWNEYFVEQLIKAGYGLENDPQEEIVDRWFRDLARNILAEEGQDVTRGAGFINVVPIAKGKSEVS